MQMAQFAAIQPTLTDAEFEMLSEDILTRARRMSTRQVLDLADALHDLIRTRQAVERSLARRHAQSSP